MSGKASTEFVKVLVQESESDSEDIQCGMCSKTFASMMALRNHAFMDHMDECAKTDPSVWGQKIKKESKPPIPKLKLKFRKDAANENKLREKIISTMEPTSLTALASENVSYIIVKSEDYEPALEKEKVEKEKRKRKEPVKKSEPKRTKSPQPITGPFECLEPSPLGTDGACHQIFFSCCEYSAHASSEHSRRRRAVRCQVCERPLGGAGGAPLACQHCGEGFQTAEQLQDHMVQKHTKQRPYECNVCHKRFTQQGGVVQHMRMHTGVRPFPCTFCNKAFTQKSGLEQHLRTHTKAKPYRCVVCAKCFAQSVHLRQHMRTHTQLAPFRCLVCDKRFKQSSHLNYHLRYHDPEQLSDEQREKYQQLVNIIRKHSKQNDAEGTTEVVETEEIHTEVTDDMTEQIIAEQSIQEDGATYIIGDTYVYQD